MSVRETILNEMRLVAGMQKRILAPLTDDLPLYNSGLEFAVFRDITGAA